MMTHRVGQKIMQCVHENMIHNKALVTLVFEGNKVLIIEQEISFGAIVAEQDKTDKKKWNK